jgi:hypothetical protein
MVLTASPSHAELTLHFMITYTTQVSVRCNRSSHPTVGGRPALLYLDKYFRT